MITKGKRVTKLMRTPRGTKRRQRRENMAAFNSERERRTQPLPEGRRGD